MCLVVASRHELPYEAPMILVNPRRLFSKVTEMDRMLGQIVGDDLEMSRALGVQWILMGISQDLFRICVSDDWVKNQFGESMPVDVVTS